MSKESRFSWKSYGFLLPLLVLTLAPLVVVFFSLFQESGAEWEHVRSTLLGVYLWDSLLLALGVLGLSFIFGCVSAWLCAYYEFPLRAILERMLYLPLAIPPYILALIYTHMFDYGGFLQPLDPWFGWLFEGMSGAILVLSLCMYPYVFMLVKTSFRLEQANTLESARLLGKSGASLFLRIALPGAFVAIIGSLLLVLMEVLNEYGAVKFLGVNTFSNGIFKAWLSLGDVNSALRLSAILLLFVLLVLMLSRKLKSLRKSGLQSKSSRVLSRKKTSRAKGLLFFLVCFAPLFLGFLLPFLQLLYWAQRPTEALEQANIAGALYNTLYLGIVGASCIVAIAFVLQYSMRASKSLWIKRLSELSLLGYSLPGAIIAIGVMTVYMPVDKWLKRMGIALFDTNWGLLLSSTTGMLLIAYLIRFLAVGSQSIESAYSRMNPSLDESAKSLSASAWKRVLTLHLPFLKLGMLSAFLLSFVDISKELPLTLILRPFNFDTLATSTYALADSSLITDAAVPALFIVLISLVPVLFLDLLTKKQSQ